jgi:hypothetical protein
MPVQRLDLSLAQDRSVGMVRKPDEISEDNAIQSGQSSESSNRPQSARASDGAAG